MMLGLKCLQGDLYLVALLEKIKLSKEVFLYDIEQGDETYIPDDINQNNFSLSFQYYDPTIALI